MKPNLSRSIGVFALFALACLCTACALTPAHHNTFIGRKGDTFSLSINGTPSERTKAKEWKDSVGRRAGESYWKSASSTGKLCFNADTSEQGFGAFLQMGIQIQEVHPDREHTRWKNYMTNPRPTTATHPPEPIWVPGQDFCPKEFFLTHRLRYKELPKGTYLLTVRYQGTKNWDAKHIWLEVN